MPCPLLTLLCLNAQPMLHCTWQGPAGDVRQPLQRQASSGINSTSSSVTARPAGLRLPRLQSLTNLPSMPGQGREQEPSSVTFHHAFKCLIRPDAGPFPPENKQLLHSVPMQACRMRARCCSFCAEAQPHRTNRTSYEHTTSQQWAKGPLDYGLPEQSAVSCSEWWAQSRVISALLHGFECFVFASRKIYSGVNILQEA